MDKYKMREIVQPLLEIISLNFNRAATSLNINHSDALEKNHFPNWFKELSYLFQLSAHSYSSHQNFLPVKIKTLSINYFLKQFVILQNKNKKQENIFDN